MMKTDAKKSVVEIRMERLLFNRTRSPRRIGRYKKSAYPRRGRRGSSVGLGLTLGLLSPEKAQRPQSESAGTAGKGCA